MFVKNLFFNKIYFYIFLYFFFLIYFFTSILVLKDFGIDIEEHFQRKNGFYWLDYLLQNTELINLKNIVSFKLNEINSYHLPNIETFPFYGIFFDITAAFLESFFKIEDSRNYFLLRHFINFFFFFISGIFFYKILKKRFKNNSLAFFGIFFYFLTPRIYGNSFHNNKDLIFLSLLTISLYFCFSFFKKKKLKNLFLFSIFSAFASSTRIIGLFIPIFLFFFFLLSNSYSRDRKKNFYSICIFFLTFILTLFLHWPYFNKIFLMGTINWFKPFLLSSNYSVLFDGDYYRMRNLPNTYIPTFILITTPIYITFFFFIGFIYKFKRFFIRLINVKEKSPYNDFWRGNNEKFDFFILISFFLTFSFIVLMSFPVAHGWRHFYFLHFFIIYFLIFFFYIINFFLKKYIFYFQIIIFFFCLDLIIQNIKFHPFQSLYFNKLVDNIENKFAVDSISLSRSHALLKILKNSNKKVISVGTAAWSPLNNADDFLEKNFRNKITFVGQDFKRADFIYSINNYEVNAKINKKYDIPLNFTLFYEKKVDDLVIYKIYKKSRK